VLFGDSITQGAWDQSRGFAFAAQLAHGSYEGSRQQSSSKYVMMALTSALDYVRRLDVINRGFRFESLSAVAQIIL
jgi:hypothetical protein